MLKKITLFLFAFLLLSNVASALETSYIFEQDEIVDLKVPCLDINDFPCTSSITCNITIQYPNSENLVNNEVMTYNPSYFNYSINDTLNLGYYSTSVFCYGTNNGFSHFQFEITPSGSVPTTSQGIMYAFLLVVGILLMVLCIYGAATMDDRNEFTLRGTLLKVNFNKYWKQGLYFLAYLCLIFIAFISWQISAKFLWHDFTTTIFYTTHLVLWIALLPLFIVFVIISLIKWMADLELMNLAKRNLPKR